MPLRLWERGRSRCESQTGKTGYLLGTSCMPGGETQPWLQVRITWGALENSDVQAAPGTRTSACWGAVRGSSGMVQAPRGIAMCSEVPSAGDSSQCFPCRIWFHPCHHPIVKTVLQIRSPGAGRFSADPGQSLYEADPPSPHVRQPASGGHACRRNYGEVPSLHVAERAGTGV